MENILVLTSPVPPSVNKYLNYRVTRRGRRSFAVPYASQETSDYKKYFTNYVKEQIEKQSWKRPSKDKLIYIRMTFYLDRKRKDPNNLIKIPIDVLTEAGVYYDDDVVLPIADRVYIDKHNPRVEIEVSVSPAIGIFDDKEQLDDFISNNCSLCKKNIETCGVMKNLKENRIIPEVENFKCSKIKLK